MDPSSLCSQGVTQSVAGHGNGGLNQGGSGLPLIGIDEPRQSWGSQLQTPDPFQFLPEPFSSDEGLNQGGSGLPLIGIDQPRQSWGSQLQTPDPFQFLPEPFSSDEGLNQGGSGLPLKCSGIDQVTQSLGSQLRKPFVHTPIPIELYIQFLQFLARGSSIQASSPKVRVDSQDREELTMEASTKRSLPINPSSCYCQGVTQPKSGLVNGGESLASSPQVCDYINVIESQTLKVQSKRKKKSTSSVWKSYHRITEKDGKERAQCIKCGKKYLIDSGKIGTSTLNRHVKKCQRNETHDVVQLEPMDQGLEPIQEENIIEPRTPECPNVPQAHISPSPRVRFDVEVDADAVLPWTTLSSAASGVLGTTTAATSKRRRLAEMQTEFDKSIWSKTSAFRPTSHDSANKSAGTEADEGKSSTPAATEEEVQAPRDLQLSLATTKSGPQEESGSVQKQFASAEELRSIGEQKKALKITLNGILDSLSKGQIECLGSCKIAVDVVLSTVGSAVDVKPLEAIFTELFASSEQWQSIQDPALLYQNEVLDRVAILRRELENEEISSSIARRERLQLHIKSTQKDIEIIWSSLTRLARLGDRALLWGGFDDVREVENVQQSLCIAKYNQMLLDMDKSLEHIKILWTEATERLKVYEARVASKLDRLKAFDSMVDGFLGVGRETLDPEFAAERYAAAHKREAMKAKLQDLSGKINDFFKE